MGESKRRKASGQDVGLAQAQEEIASMKSLLVQLVGVEARVNADFPDTPDHVFLIHGTLGGEDGYYKLEFPCRAFDARDEFVIKGMLTLVAGLNPSSVGSAMRTFMSKLEPGRRPTVLPSQDSERKVGYHMMIGNGRQWHQAIFTEGPVGLDTVSDWGLSKPDEWLSEWSRVFFTTLGRFRRNRTATRVDAGGLAENALELLRERFGVRMHRVELDVTGRAGAAAH